MREKPQGKKKTHTDSSLTSLLGFFKPHTHQQTMSHCHPQPSCLSSLQNHLSHHFKTPCHIPSSHRVMSHSATAPPCHCHRPMRLPVPATHSEFLIPICKRYALSHLIYPYQSICPPCQSIYQFNS